MDEGLDVGDRIAESSRDRLAHVVDAGFRHELGQAIEGFRPPALREVTFEFEFVSK